MTTPEPPARFPLQVRLTPDSAAHARVDAGCMHVPMGWETGKDTVDIDLTIPLMDAYGLNDIMRALLSAATRPAADKA